MSAENITSALPVGYMLRGYRIERALGRGGFGITYLATENITGRKVVIKENYPRGVATRESANYGVRAVDADNEEVFEWSLRSFVDEARVLTTLRHPHIVQVLTAFKELGTAYYVMDYIGGNSLSKMHHGNITEQRLLDILRPILSALHYIHTLPEMLLHRDIKSDNILITPEGTPVLIDFGAARAVVSNKTQTKIGTVGYAPPEQWASGAVRGPWTDLYALGATCYYLLTGQNPPDCHDRMFAAPGSDLLAKSAKLQQTFTPELLASIDKAFALRPADRWQSAQEWLNAITPKQVAQPGPTIPAPETINLPTENSKPSPTGKKQAAQAELRLLNISEDRYDDELFNAAEEGNIELINLLIAAGADVNKVHGWWIFSDTPLSRAASKGKAESIKCLLKAPNINVNKGNKINRTPLHQASEKGHSDCVRALLEAPGINVHAKDKQGHTPIFLIKDKKCMDLLIAFESTIASEKSIYSLRKRFQSIFKKILLIFLISFCVVNYIYVCFFGLHDAIQEDKLQLFNFYLKYWPGIQVNKRDEYNRTPLHYAAENGQIEAVKALLNAEGIEVNKRDKNNRTPLHYAAKNGQIEAVKALLNAKGIEVNTKDKNKKSPLDLAVENKEEGCANLIRTKMIGTK